ncbi:hypothetical protein PR048_025541 [Dryococelus australis]|uniref:Uncharacterized protein n=1 Tax=Dryococelus australis TaxID=614101 RepID=A0ABQ9GRJ7_9NEOP|nr:hypothetical protein PR048_025541 [Dryococelus australis]
MEFYRKQLIENKNLFLKLSHKKSLNSMRMAGYVQAKIFALFFMCRIFEICTTLTKMVYLSRL